MARAQHVETVALAQPDGTLKALAGVQVYVYNAGTTITVPIYQARSGGTPINNPLTTDSTGRVVFYAETGEYDIRFLDSQTPPRIADQTQGLSLADANIATADLIDAAVTLAKLDSGVLQALVPAGCILPTARASAPLGWLMCDGSPVSRSTYAGLLAAIGVVYGAGDGSTTFNVPDLRGRVPVGVDGTAGRLSISDTLGTSGGAEKHTLLASELADHQHGIPVSSATGAGPAYAYVMGQRLNAEAPLPGTPVGTTGMGTPTSGNNLVTPLPSTGQPHNNMQPFILVNHIIKT